MPKVKKVVRAADKAKSNAESSGIVLKVAFPDYDDEARKTLRRHLRKALRAKDAPQFRFHKIGTRWVFPTKKDVTAARAIAAEVPSLSA